MTLEKFRIAHSTLIEHYQFIEAHLEEIYAACSGKTLLEGLKDVEKDSLGVLLKEIGDLEEDKKICILKDEEYTALQQVFQRRNFWCHNCYYDLVFDSRTGAVARAEDVQQMLVDLKTAEQWRDRLFEKKMHIFKENRKMFMPGF